jgi:hypothetical protein
MELIAEVHLEDWDTNEEETIYIKDKLQICIEGNKYILKICDMDGEYRAIKEVTQYWEVESLNYFINSDTNDDITQDEYQREFSTHIRDTYLSYDYLVIHRENNAIFGTNDLFDYSGWVNKDLEKMWYNGKIDIIDINNVDDIYPLILDGTGSWDEIKNIKKGSLLGEFRDKTLEGLL